MIVPLAHEPAWLELLRTQPPFPERVLTAAKSLVVIAPHPDDETLGAGGLIAAQCESTSEVVVVAVTNGENAYASGSGLGEIRALEQDRAVAQLGVRKPIVRLNLPDSSVAEHEAALTNLLLPSFGPGTLVLAPWPNDFHPDHEACGRAAASAARISGAAVAFYFFWTWHRGTPDLLAGLPLYNFALTPKLLSKKLAALKEHRSQLEREDGEPILPENLLEPAKRPFEVYLLP